AKYAARFDAIVDFPQPPLELATRSLSISVSVGKCSVPEPTPGRPRMPCASRFRGQSPPPDVRLPSCAGHPAYRRALHPVAEPRMLWTAGRSPARRPPWANTDVRTRAQGWQQTLRPPSGNPLSWALPPTPPATGWLAAQGADP